MTTNRLATPTDGKAARGCPSDMPRGDSAADKAERQRYWIAKGNAKLFEAGLYHLQWAAKDGHYWIEPR